MSPRVRAILEAVADEYGFAVADLLSRCRVHSIAHARFDAMFRIRALRSATGSRIYSYPAIGRIFGLDHTSVLHGIRRWIEIANIVDTDELEMERQQVVEMRERALKNIEQATVRIAEIDALLAASYTRKSAQDGARVSPIADVKADLAA